MIGALKGFMVAIVVAHGFQQNEMVEPRKALEDAGATVHLVSIERGTVQGWDWYVPCKLDDFNVDVYIDDAKPEHYDALMLPGGLTGPDDLRMSEKAQAFIKSCAHKPMAVQCHGVWQLVDAGVLPGKTVTSWPGIKNDIINAGATWVDIEAIRCGNIVTSRHAGDIPAFNTMMLELFTQAHNKKTTSTFTLMCPEFSHKNTMPLQYAADGHNISPALQWINAPIGTQSFALIVDDPDAGEKSWVHWIVFNIPATTTELPEGVQSDSFTCGITDFYYMRNGIWQYCGPCPPSGTHNYHFTLYALNTTLHLGTDITKEDLTQAMAGHILEQTTLIGLYKREKHI